MIRWLAPTLLVLVAISAGAARAAPAPPLYQWVQYAPGGVEARAVVDGDGPCPAIVVDGKSSPMAVRAPPAPGFPITVCAARLPAGAKAATLAGRALPLPKPRPDRILVIGDTGCRVTTIIHQACNDPGAWPFPKGSAVEAGLKPDLVLHVGDFHYREAPCPLAASGCAGSPHGDTWAVWKADFFEPAKPLLDSAPFVLVRGNHEECERGGKGWSRTLDPYPDVSDDGCLGLGAPFVVDLGDPRLVVLDVSTAAETRASPTQVPFFRDEFRSIAKLVPDGRAWVAFHRPIWASGAYAFGFTIGDNKTLAAAARDDIPANVDLLLSGHIHTFEILKYKEDLPIQIVSGHGGDDLHRTAPSNPAGEVIDGVTIADGRGAPGVFGFVMLERAGADWTATNYDMDGAPHVACRLRGRDMSCD